VPGARWLPLRGGFALVDEDLFENLNALNWFIGSKGYAQRSCTGGGAVLLHRVVLWASPGDWVDHINRDKLDCRRSNLRFVSYEQSAQNRNKSTSIRKTSRYKGVSFRKRGCVWIAQITVSKVQTVLGRFKNQEDAARAYDRAAREFFGLHAYFNFPKEFS